MESPEVARGPSFWHKPVEILLFGAFSIIFGLLEVIAATAVGSNGASNLWPFVAWAGVGMVVCGVGFIVGRQWGYAGSVLIFLLAYLASIIQAFQREFVWGIFFDPVVLIFLLIPRVRSYFVQAESQPAKVVSSQGGIPTGSSGFTSVETSPMAPTPTKKITRATKPSNVLTIIAMLGIITPVPLVAATVHTVTVTEVTLNILYPPGSTDNNITSIWFGFSTRTVSGPMFTWGAGKMGLSFSLTNLGLFQQHTVDSIRVTTPGFILDYVGLPFTVPDLAAVTFHMVLQAPDYDYNGPVVLDMNTT